MAKKARATFQKTEKERARQQKQRNKVQRRLEAKEQRVLQNAGPGNHELDSDSTD